VDPIAGLQSNRSPGQQRGRAHGQGARERHPAQLYGLPGGQRDQQGDEVVLKRIGIG